VSRILEQGNIFFFYRPRVRVDQVDDLSDVRNFSFLLKPDDRSLYRRVIVGRKRLPEPREHERNWAFVVDVTEDPSELREEIESEPKARPVGEGRYAIAEHDNHTHLVYLLELPRQPGRAQDVFRIRPEASYIIAVRNPHADAPSPAGLRPDQRAKYPPELMEYFGNRRFIAVVDRRLLDYEGAEMVLIGAAEDVSAELGIDLDPEEERLEDADPFRNLDLHPAEMPTEPLQERRLIWRAGAGAMLITRWVANGRPARG
jgi:hypothetical protein